MVLGLITCVEVEEVVSVLTPVVSGVAQAFHDLLVELRLQLVADVEEGEEEDRQAEGWEVESGVLPQHSCVVFCLNTVPHSSFEVRRFVQHTLWSDVNEFLHCSQEVCSADVVVFHFK